MDVIGSMTRAEMIRVHEEAQNLFRYADLSQLTIHEDKAEFDFYPAERHGSNRNCGTKKKAELRTVHDGIGLLAQLSTAKGGRPKVEARTIVGMTAFALVTVDDGASVVYMVRFLSNAQPVDIKLNDVETTIRIQIVGPNGFLAQLRKRIDDSHVVDRASNGVKSLKTPGRRRNRGKPKQAAFVDKVLEHVRRTGLPSLFVMVLVLLTSVWYLHHHVRFLYTVVELDLEGFSCKHCYSTGVYSFFQQSFHYLYIVISMLGHLYVAAHVVRTRSSGPYPRFAAFEALRVSYNFVTEYVIAVFLLLWNVDAGFKGLVRKVFGALIISIGMASVYWRCLSAAHADLVPGVHFQGYWDVERGYIDAVQVIRNLLEDDAPRELPEHMNF